MDAPPIQYARSADGTELAWWTWGDGVPVVSMPLLPLSDGHRWWEIPQLARLNRRYAQAGLRIVHYDARGSGNSARHASSYALEAMVADVVAVADAAGLEEFALGAMGLAGPVALRFVAQYPERVHRLQLHDAYACADDFLSAPETRAVQAMAAGDMESFAQTWARMQLGWREGDGTQAYLAVIRGAGGEPTVYAAIMESIRGWDARSCLEGVRVPTLVTFERAGAAFYEPTTARALAAAVPGAHLRGFEAGDDGYPTDQMVDAIAAFFTGRSGAPSAVGTGGAVRTVLFTDLEASTELTRRLGDDQAQEVLRGHNAVVRSSLDDHGGTEIKHTGDGIMASFPSAVSAVRAALQIQRDLATAEVRVRIGLNAGEPIAEEDDLFGLSVIKAARIADRAEPGQVLVSDVVRQLAEGKRFTFTSIGQVSLKGFDEPVVLYAVEAD